jgi:hypothetical protein
MQVKLSVLMSSAGVVYGHFSQRSGDNVLFIFTDYWDTPVSAAKHIKLFFFPKDIGQLVKKWAKPYMLKLSNEVKIEQDLPPTHGSPRQKKTFSKK